MGEGPREWSSSIKGCRSLDVGLWRCSQLNPERCGTPSVLLSSGSLNGLTMDFPGR